MTDAYGTDDWKSVPKGVTTKVFKLIGVATGRGFESAWNRYHHFGPSFGTEGCVRGAPRPRTLAERAARDEARDKRNLTAVFFGDPPPGYSALDQRRRHEVAPR